MSARRAVVEAPPPAAVSGRVESVDAPAAVVSPIRGIDVWKFRRRLRVSQQTLAEWLHVSLSCLRNWERRGTDALRLNGASEYFLRQAMAAAEEDEVPEEIGACLEADDPDRAWLAVFETGRRER
jgi:DNA-binding transcriptional regulator YiaG